MIDGGVCRTAPATPGLLNICTTFTLTFFNLYFVDFFYFKIELAP